MIDLVATDAFFTDLLADIVRLHDGLAFYALSANWENVLTDDAGWVTGPALDGGDRARAALDGAE